MKKNRKIKKKTLSFLKKICYNESVKKGELNMIRKLNNKFTPCYLRKIKKSRPPNV